MAEAQERKRSTRQHVVLRIDTAPGAGEDDDRPGGFTPVAAGADLKAIRKWIRDHGDGKSQYQPAVLIGEPLTPIVEKVEKRTLPGV